VNRYVAGYDTLTEQQAKEMLDEKMAIEKERMQLKQTYTKKVEKVLPPKKALRYAQIETRVDNMLRRDVYGLIPLAR
jgi:Tfp pilus assembly protein PilO